MSNALYLTCLDHDPPLSSYWHGGEVGHRLSDLPKVRELIGKRDTFIAAADLDPEYLDRCTTAAATFLCAHPRCRIGIVDEYGDTHPTTTEETDDNAGR
ncbi:hypothetical protein I5G63_gp050 [Mycobacterium phage Imvubu]|uniref:Uncharacterized protein n=1 Tax=Mycobacterium phage Imvubu TaxID=2686233 RepID=A0A6B9LDV0_9CAUD|nr:hypothetical protein I5G63_gp050 [Mycobacterium phage Imvubu]QHB37791.1 hypothetical protein PBI_IMVUBU_50 [Mycobacterium phage Imvubu]